MPTPPTSASPANPANPSDPSDRLDAADVRCCLAGDAEAFARIVGRRQDAVSAMMWRFSRDAETHCQLVQDVFVEAWGGLRGWRGDAPFAHWLARVATRVGYQHWKRLARERRQPVVSLEDWNPVADPPAGAPDVALRPGEAEEAARAAGQAAARLFSLLAQLAPRDRLALTLRFVEGLDVAATARRTGWSETMVKVQTWRARRRLKKLFERANKEA